MAQKQAKETQKDIGIEVVAPTTTCSDRKCPFHGSLKLHGRTFIGQAIGNVFHKTLAIEFERTVPIPKYERIETRKSRIKTHVPPCMAVQKGDKVKVMETKPISKTKNFVAIEVLKQ